MQLSSTLFAFAVLPLKPQLEKLTRDLLKLFIEYQIPSDLLSYTGEDTGEVTTPAKRDYVRKQTDKILEIVEEAKRLEQQKKDEERKKQEFELTNEYYEMCSQQDQQLEMLQCSVDSIKSMAMDISCESTFDRLLSINCIEAASDVVPGFNFMAQPTQQLSAPAKSAPAKSAPANSAPAKSAPAKPVPAKPVPVAKSPPAKPTTTAPKLSVEEIEPKHSFAQELVQRSVEVEDYTKIPKALDSAFDKLDTDDSLRPTIIDTATLWERKSYSSLISPPKQETLSEDDLIHEKNRSFDMLDALSRSGVLAWEHAQFHVVFMATHCFDMNLIDTVIQKNENPIEKIEKSTLILASCLQGAEPQELVSASELARVSQYSPNLF